MVVSKNEPKQATRQPKSIQPTQMKSHRIKSKQIIILTSHHTTETTKNAIDCYSTFIILIMADLLYLRTLFLFVVD